MADVVVAPHPGAAALAQAAAQRAQWRRVLAQRQHKAFVEVHVGSTLRGGVCNLLAASGLGGLRPNTLALGLPASQAGQQGEGEAAQAGVACSAEEWAQIVNDAAEGPSPFNLMVPHALQLLDKEQVERRAGRFRRGDSGCASFLTA